MAEGSTNVANRLPMLGTENPAQLRSKEARVRFALAKAYGMGKGEDPWSREQIADALDVSKRTVSNYLNNTELADEVRDVLAATQAEWRLEMALELRKEVKRLDAIIEERAQKKQAVPTRYDTKTVEGTPTGDQNIRLPDVTDTHRLQMAVPVDYEEVTAYDKSLQQAQAEKRQYLDRIANLLDLDSSDQRDVDETLAANADEVKIVEFRQSDDPYPDADPIDMADGDPDAARDVVDVEADVVDPADDSQHTDPAAATRGTDTEDA